MEDDENVIDLDARRQEMAPVAVTHVEPPEWPTGPFKVTISDRAGKMFEVEFSDYSGDLAPEASMLGTGGIPNVERLTVNLLAGALRAFAGAR